MKFNINNYQGKYVMHCKTEEEAKDFCTFLHSIGRKWCIELPYLDDTRWHYYEGKTAYNFNNGQLGYVEYYRNKGYTVLEWSDFMGMSNERTKELYNNMLDYIVESVGKSNAVDVLRAIGFTDEEIIACGVQIGEEELI